MLGQPQPPALRDRIDQLPGELRERVKNRLESDEAVTLDQLLSMLPDKKLDQRAHLPRDSQLHWLYAALSAGVFACLISLCFAPGTAPPLHILGVGLFTGTVGVLLLLLAHVYGPLAAFIELCMVNAEDPNTDFFVVFVGFTIGVGLVEETCKLLPLLWYYRRHRTITWRVACLWGLASGAGFGIAEGIMYSTSFYHGIEPVMDYVVRFASCVALHAIWTASAGITLWKHQDLFAEAHRGADEPLYYKGVDTKSDADERASSMAALYGMAVLRSIAVVMLLHGLYDGLLTRNKFGLALGAAIASFSWLAWQIESCRRAESGPTATDAAVP